MAKGRKTGGRRPGSPNKATREVREVFRAVFEKLAPNAEGWILAAGKEDPAKGADLLLRLAEYHVPKLGRLEHTGKDGGPVRVSYQGIRGAVKP